MQALVDNDVIIKICAYQLTEEFREALTFNRVPPTILGVGRFVIRERLSRTGRRSTGSTAALAAFESLLPNLILVEPDEHEAGLAARFESAALRLNLELDGGESQLLAILLSRASRLLLTGDKRAISAMAKVAKIEAGRIACLEQCIATLLQNNDWRAVCTSVCREPHVDKSLTICCGCASGTPPSLAGVLEALASYTESVRRRATDILLAGTNLSALAA